MTPSVPSSNSLSSRTSRSLSPKIDVSSSLHPHRVTHQIRLSALRHNYSAITSAASRQQCSVICVVKADGYGHGAIETSLHLADYCGADAFAVATVDEGVALRKALNQKNLGTAASSTMPLNAQVPPATKGTNSNLHLHSNGGANTSKKKTDDNNSISNLFQPPSSVVIGGNASKTSETSSIGSVPFSLSSLPLPHLPTTKQVRKNQMRARSPNIRILVLGPPTNPPDDFALYQQFNLELMCSGPQMARQLMEFVADCDARRILEVEKAATYQQSILMQGEDELMTAKFKNPGQASTLSNTEGEALCKELRAILRKKESLERTNGIPTPSENGNGDHSTAMVSAPNQGLAPHGNLGENTGLISTTQSSVGGVQSAVPFKGIEDTAKSSRAREMAVAKVLAQTTGEDEDGDGIENDEQNGHSISTWNEIDADDTAVVSTVSSAAVKDATKKVANPSIKKGIAPTSALRKIRWHALIDSGMGRLGFKSVEDDYSDEDRVLDDNAPDPLDNLSKKNSKWKVDPHRDTVSIIKAMADAEIYGGAPIEFFGMCTHMAEASSDSNYTNEQMTRFKSLLKRVRQAGISVPTISTDNSSALLTTNLTHFNPAELLAQRNGTNSLGYVRTGGGIFGQRPAFPKLKPISSLTASVRHVAILQEGQSVGYDRAYIATRNVRIATLTCGFADGYPRALGNGKGSVSIRGSLFPIAGNVCMDMMMVDLGSSEDKEGIGSKVCVGDTAFLWGNDDESGSPDGQIIRLQDLSETLSTTQSALTCGLDKVRVQRQYVE